ncbi:MAG: outer membrane beta-barrel protein [Bacteroidota bacterium]
MKKQLVIWTAMCCFLFGGVSSLQAQQYFGASVGGGLSSLSGPDDDDFISFLFSNRAGFTYQYQLAEVFGLRLESSWSSRGTSYEIQLTDVNGLPLGKRDNKERLNYVHFHLMGRAELDFFYIASGPYFSILTGGSRNFPDSFPTDNRGVKDVYKNTDFGIGTSFGFLIPFSDRGRIELGLQSTMGLIDIFERNVIGDLDLRTFEVGLVCGVQVQID